ncbi:calcium-binding and coiled-coil domain-containing protein 2 isoform X2 [Pseudopipra pipra]|uniref:calcium-binding and coiled-coil domain-containing protein 2 isoform X2 n=1 Tax=Pseudopipra pipra TaxID=415032 RepID=UPI0031398761
MGAELSQPPTMDGSCEDPPTSALLLDSCHFSHVLFNDVEKFYVPGGDVTCHYTLTQNITARGKDWVGIFRVGWKTTREYYTFMWAPLPAAGHGDTAVQQKIQFKAYYLPKDDEYYQFCYVDQDGMVRGASVPFQFRAEAEDDILVVTTQGEVEEIELQNKNLRQENEELKASCANLQQQNLELQEELKKTQELQKSLESLRSNTEKLELELNSLKVENKHLKEQGDCTGAELQQLKEQIQSVTSEKERLESRLRTALDHMDQLQSQVLNYEKEVENLSHVDQEKTEQLETLKEENQQLRLSTAQQKLRAENSALLRHLSQATELSPLSALPRAPAAAPAPGAGDLLFGNPYSAAGGNLGAGAEASLRVCPLCGELFPGAVESSEYEAHVRSHLLDCPMCTESFENKQVYEDHLLCHRLE